MTRPVSTQINFGALLKEGMAGANTDVRGYTKSNRKAFSITPNASRISFDE
ncbi:MAG: hypothetical protein AB2L24_24485 [Mangrovibacterium sp.]